MVQDNLTSDGFTVSTIAGSESRCHVGYAQSSILAHHIQHSWTKGDMSRIQGKPRKGEDINIAQYRLMRLMPGADIYEKAHVP